MKIGASYSVWDGEELLEFSIRSIRNAVDYVNVVWQRLSWYGTPCDDGLEEHLQRLKGMGLIDELFYFEPELGISPNLNETNKRNVGLEAARARGCSHLITMDTDEFYDETEFKQAAEYLLRYDITHSACNQFMYDAIDLRRAAPADWFAPFLYQISQGQIFECNAFPETPWMIDPSKKILITADSKLCFLGQVTLHHYRAVRKNLSQKIDNSSEFQNPEARCQAQSEYEGLIESANKANEGTHVRMPNQFGIHF